MPQTDTHHSYLPKEVSIRLKASNTNKYVSNTAVTTLLHTHPKVTLQFYSTSGLRHRQRGKTFFPALRSFSADFTTALVRVNMFAESSVKTSQGGLRRHTWKKNFMLSKHIYIDRVLRKQKTNKTRWLCKRKSQKLQKRAWRSKWIIQNYKKNRVWFQKEVVQLVGKDKPENCRNRCVEGQYFSTQKTPLRPCQHNLYLLYPSVMILLRYNNSCRLIDSVICKDISRSCINNNLNSLRLEFSTNNRNALVGASLRKVSEATHYFYELYTCFCSGPECKGQ